MGERDHGKALDELRVHLMVQVDDALKARRWTSEPDYERDIARSVIAQIRALDAVRAMAQHGKFSSEMWMLIACGKTQLEAAKEARAMCDRTREIVEP